MTSPTSPGWIASVFYGKRRSNATHASTTDPETKIKRMGRGKGLKQCFMGHLLMENQHGLLVIPDRLGVASGMAERDEAAAMVADVPVAPRITDGGDKLFDTQGLTALLRALGATPYAARHTTGRRSAIDRRTTRHPG